MSESPLVHCRQAQLMLDAEQDPEDTCNTARGLADIICLTSTPARGSPRAPPISVHSVSSAAHARESSGEPSSSLKSCLVTLPGQRPTLQLEASLA